MTLKCSIHQDEIDDLLKKAYSDGFGACMEVMSKIDRLEANILQLEADTTRRFDDLEKNDRANIRKLVDFLSKFT